MNTITVFVVVASVLFAAIDYGSCSKKHKSADSELYNGLLYIENEERELENLGSGDDTIKDIEIEKEETGCPAAAQRNTDKFIDEVLEQTRPKLPEPAFLPERVGRFRLFNGTLENLASLERTGPAMVRCTESTFSSLVPVGFQNLTGRYYWETDASGLPVFRGFIDMFIGRVEADVLYTRNRRVAEERATVEKLKIQKLEGVRVTFDGLGPMNRIASRFTNLVTKFFSKGVSRALEGPVRNAINRELKNVEKYEKYYF